MTTTPPAAPLSTTVHDTAGVGVDTVQEQDPEPVGGENACDLAREQLGAVARVVADDHWALLAIEVGGNALGDGTDVLVGEVVTDHRPPAVGPEVDLRCHQQAFCPMGRRTRGRVTGLRVGAGPSCYDASMRVQRRLIGPACGAVLTIAAVAGCGDDTKLPEAPSSSAFSTSAVTITQQGNANATIDTASVTFKLDDSRSLVARP